VFRKPVNGLNDLKTRIRNAISAIPVDMLHRTWQELEYCLDVLRATNGGHMRSTEANKNLLEFHYDLPQIAGGYLNLFAGHNFSKLRRDFVDTHTHMRFTAHHSETLEDFY
jgi:hypothetical protein